MNDYDLFDLVDLAFDPPEKNSKIVKKKLDQKQEQLEALYAQNIELTKSITFAELEFLKKMRAFILTPDETKLMEENFKTLAEQRKNKKLTELTGIVRMLRLTGQTQVTEAMMRHYKNQMRLCEENIKEIFVNEGFDLIKRNVLAAFPKFPNTVDRLHMKLEALRKTKDENPNAPDVKKVVDLYSFAAYLKADVEHVEQYRAMQTSALCELFDEAVRKYSHNTDDLGSLCKDISSGAKSHVFEDEQKREAYERYLIYHSPALREIFDTMKTMPKESLLQSGFADAIIKKICEYFPQYEVALAIYNREAEFRGTFYEPKIWAYTIKCNACEAVSTFESEESAMQTNECSNCKRSLFKVCDKCAQQILISQSKCPHCNYVFASAAMFSNLYHKAQEALRNSDFDRVRKLLFEAQSVAPAEKKNIDQLLKTVEEQEARVREPLNLLRRLIAERKFQSAREQIAQTIRNYPNLNIGEYERVVYEKMAKIDALYASAEREPMEKKADACVLILQECVDYSPALLYLQSTPPSAIKQFILTTSSSTRGFLLNWEASMQKGVRYRLLRKTGKEAPRSVDDGVVVYEGTGISYTDEEVQAGLRYSYALFAVRMERASAPVSKTSMLFFDVENFEISQNGVGIRMTWDLPPNCIGASIYRSCEGSQITLSEGAQGAYEDFDISLGKTYSYRICANYKGGAQSEGIEKRIEALASIGSFHINASLIQEELYEFKWSIKERGIALRLMVNERLAAQMKSEDGALRFELPKQSLNRVYVLAFSGGKWFKSDNILTLNTYLACAMDKKATKIEEEAFSTQNGMMYRSKVQIVLAGEVPSEVKSFYYSVRTSKSSERWVIKEQAMKVADMKKISIDEYRQHGCITFEERVREETAFFITLFTCYEVRGQEIISEAQKMKVERPLEADLFWGVKYGFFDGLKLNLEMRANRPFDYVPALVLCVCDDDVFLSSHNDPKAILLLQIDAMDFDAPVSEYRQSFAIKSELTLKYLKKCKYFLFNMENFNNDRIALRWIRGFLGKV